MSTDAKTDIEKGEALTTQDDKRTLIAVIGKMRLISKEQYDSKMYDNIYSIFMQLSPAERRILLKGIINIILIVEDKAENGTLSEQQYAKTATIASVQQTVLQVEENINGNMTNIEEFHRIEMIKLKSRITIIGLIAIAIGLLGMSFISVYMSNSKSETISIFSELWKILAEILGIAG